MSSEQFREVVLSAATALFKQHHGPAQYLQQRYHNQVEKDMYLKKLWTMFPPTATEQYQASMQICTDEQKPLALHLATLSFDPMSSPREPTRAHVALELLDHYLTDGFVSISEPVLTHAGDPDCIAKLGVPMLKESIPWAEPGQEPLQPLGVALQKGNARVCTFI